MTNKKEKKPKPINKKPNNKKPKKMRLDDLLVSRGFFEDRQEALRAVLAGDVRVEVVEYSTATSPAQMVPPTARVKVKAPRKYVSRGGFKLEGALREFNQNVQGLRCIDIGSSTGGFTDCLLQNGAASVACIDVNYGQLSWKLRQDPRVTPHERTNIRTANPETIGAPFDLLVADLSFIGLSTLAATFANYCKAGSVLIALVKPQFESAQGEADGGYVSSESVRQRCVEEVRAALQGAGFCVTHTTTSSIKGKKRGNIEYLVRAVFEPPDN